MSRASAGRYTKNLSAAQMDSYSNLLIADMRLQELSGRSGLYLECGEAGRDAYVARLSSLEKELGYCAKDAADSGIMYIPEVRRACMDIGIRPDSRLVREAEFRNPVWAQRRLIEIILTKDMELTLMNVSTESHEKLDEKSHALKFLKLGIQKAANLCMKDWEVIKYISSKYGVESDYNRLHHSLIAEISGN